MEQDTETSTSPMGAEDLAEESRPGSETPTVLPDGSECFEGAFKPLWGDLHTHVKDHETPTRCENTPAQLFDEAKARGLGFIQITEHVWRLTANALASCEAAAAARTTDTFRPSCGFETNVTMADGSYSGHANALWSQTNHNTDASDAVGEQFPTASGKRNFYSFLDAKKAVGQINHPNSAEDGWPDRAAAHVNEAVDLVEVSGGCAGCADRDAAAIKTFLSFVNAGWRVSPSMNSDTHCMKPGRRTGAWVATTSVKAALRNHRTFVQSYEPPKGSDNTFRLTMVKDADGVAHRCWMGSKVKRGGAKASLRVELRGHMVSSGARGSVTMKIFAKGKDATNPARTVTCGPSGPCTCTADRCVWSIDDVPSGDTSWFVAHAQSTVGDKVAWTLSSPVWLTD